WKLSSVTLKPNCSALNPRRRGDLLKRNSINYRQPARDSCNQNLRGAARQYGENHELHSDIIRQKI
ncbi:MAG: hypothetical protein E6051_26585, partial [Citrobacter freundii]|nr:hypothetical protein [Citrobacter freundii]